MPIFAAADGFAACRRHAAADDAALRRFFFAFHAYLFSQFRRRHYAPAMPRFLLFRALRYAAMLFHAFHFTARRHWRAPPAH